MSWSQGRLTRSRCSSGAGMAPATRTAGSGPAGQSGSSARSLNGTPGPSTPPVRQRQKPTRPTRLAPIRSAMPTARRPHCRSTACMPSAIRTPAGPHEHERRFGRCSRAACAWHCGRPVNPSAASCRTPCSNPHTAIEPASIQKRLPSTSGSSTQRVITEREKWPWPDEHDVARGHVLQRQCHGLIGAVADLRHGFAAGAAVRPDQPVGN